MLQSDEEIFIAVITTAFLMVFLIAVIVIAIVKYQNRIRHHLMEVNNLKNIYQQEILKAQLEMQEQTFLSISQEIHDNIGQILSLIILNITTINFDNTLGAKNKIESSKELLIQAMEDLRALSKRLNIDFISRQSLPELIKFHLNLIQKGEQHQTNFEKHGKENFFDSEVKLFLVRIIQEALNNIIKHAEATTITIILEYFPDKAILTIKDNGKGFDPNKPPDGIGIQNMKRRADLINAKFSIQNAPEGGVIIQLIIPNNK